MEIPTLDQSEVVKNLGFRLPPSTSPFRGRVAEPGIQSRAFTILDSGIALHALRNDGVEIRSRESIFAERQSSQQGPVR